MLVVSTNDGPVSDGLPPPRIVAVLLVEVERGDRQVALQVGLLVDENWIFPALTASAASLFRSNVPSLAWLFTASIAFRASSACGAPRVMIQLIVLVLGQLGLDRRGDRGVVLRR